MKTTFVRNIVIVGRKCDRFPVVFREDGSVILEIERYLMSEFRGGSSDSTLETYARHLFDLYSQLQVDGRGVGQITEEYLNQYREAIEERASSHYAAQVLRTVLAFLDYLEKKKTIQGVIGERIGYAVVIERSKRGAIIHSLSNGTKSPKSNQCPTDSAIETIKTYGPSDPRLITRFELMIDWCHVKGLRAKEVCGLEISQIPDDDSILRALEDDVCLELTLTVTKGGRARKVDVHPILLSRTAKWIETDRHSMVLAARNFALAEGVTFEESKKIFVAKDGQSAITPRAFSNSVRRAFKGAVLEGELTGAERVWVHGLRKRMINREIDARHRDEDARDQGALRQQTGHGSLKALARYVVDTQ